MPGYVHVCYLLCFLLVPFALLVPAPTVLARRAAPLGYGLFLVSVGLLVAGGAMVVSRPVAWPGMSVALLSVCTFMLMLWMVGSHRPRRRPPEDDGGGDGRGPRRAPDPPEPPKPPEPPPPAPPRAPEVVGPDWNDFDRRRREWERQPEPALC